MSVELCKTFVDRAWNLQVCGVSAQISCTAARAFAKEGKPLELHIRDARRGVFEAAMPVSLPVLAILVCHLSGSREAGRC